MKSRTHLLALLELQENEADLLAEGVKKYGLLKKKIAAYLAHVQEVVEGLMDYDLFKDMNLSVGPRVGTL